MEENRDTSCFQLRDLWFSWYRGCGPMHRMAERNASSDGGSEGGSNWEALGRLEAQRGTLQQAADAAEAGQAAATSLLTECKQDLARQQQVCCFYCRLALCSWCGHIMVQLWSDAGDVWKRMMSYCNISCLQLL